MKTKILLSFLNLCFMLFITISCKSQPNSSDEQVLSMLKSFYMSYITENAKMPPNVSKVNSLKEKYCTAKLLRRVEQEELDYDPFLKAQASNTEWLKTLVVKKDKIGNNQYSVSFTDPYNDSQIVIKLIVKIEKESYKIDSIL
jgi:hypothetical protein